MTHHASGATLTELPIVGPTVIDAAPAAHAGSEFDAEAHERTLHALKKIGSVAAGPEVAFLPDTVDTAPGYVEQTPEAFEAEHAALLADEARKTIHGVHDGAA